MSLTIDIGELSYKDELKLFAIKTELIEHRFRDTSYLNYYRIILLPKGNNALTIDFKSYKIEECIAIFLSPNQEITIDVEQPSTLSMLVFSQDFYCIEKHDSAVSCNGWLFNNHDDMSFMPLDHEKADHVYRIIYEMAEEFKMPDIVHEDMLKLQLKQLQILLARLKKKQSGTHKDHANNIDHELFRSFNRLVDKYYASKHLVADYADLLNMQTVLLSRKLKRITKNNPLSMIQARVLLEAKRQLLYSDDSIKQIAYNLGFEDAAYFSKFFKRLQGGSPKLFRQNK